MRDFSDAAKLLFLRLRAINIPAGPLACHLPFTLARYSFRESVRLTLKVVGRHLLMVLTKKYSFA